MASRIREDHVAFQAPTLPTRKEKTQVQMTFEGHEEWVHGVAIILELMFSPPPLLTELFDCGI
jgi:hypothetical protein